MRELDIVDAESVNGGVLPLIAGAVVVGKYLTAGFAAGVAVGSVAYLWKEL
ncbi:MAG: class IIb bacteriocin, lactobin A/cerein 7B family [Aestuariibacter sp.]